jgi:F-type H+-transporting ATPase subunit epsilon
VRADDIDEAAAVEAQKKAEQELADNKSSIDFSRVSADLAEQAAMLRTIRKHREQKR